MKVRMTILSRHIQFPFGFSYSNVSLNFYSCFSCNNVSLNFLFPYGGHKPYPVELAKIILIWVESLSK